MYYLVWLVNLLVLPILLIMFVCHVLLAALAIYFKSTTGALLATRSAIGIDQAANALLGGNEDQTMSGRMGYRIKTGKASKFELWLCKQLSKIDPYTTSHCEESIEYDELEK